MRAQGIEVAGVEFEPSARHQKRSRDPTRRKAYDAVTRRQRLEYEIAIGHRKSQCPLARASGSGSLPKFPARENRRASTHTRTPVSARERKLRRTRVRVVGP